MEIRNETLRYIIEARHRTRYLRLLDECLSSILRVPIILYLLPGMLTSVIMLIAGIKELKYLLLGSLWPIIMHVTCILIILCTYALQKMCHLIQRFFSKQYAEESHNIERDLLALRISYGVVGETQTHQSRLYMEKVYGVKVYTFELDDGKVYIAPSLIDDTMLNQSIVVQHWSKYATKVIVVK